MKQEWLRRCNECGHEDSYPPPNFEKELTDAYRNKKCKKCKSEGLDYGSWASSEEDGE